MQSWCNINIKKVNFVLGHPDKIIHLYFSNLFGSGPKCCPHLVSCMLFPNKFFGFFWNKIFFLVLDQWLEDENLSVRLICLNIWTFPPCPHLMDVEKCCWAEQVGRSHGKYAFIRVSSAFHCFDWCNFHKYLFGPVKDLNPWQFPADRLAGRQVRRHPMTFYFVIYEAIISVVSKLEILEHSPCPSHIHTTTCMGSMILSL